MNLPEIKMERAKFLANQFGNVASGSLILGIMTPIFTRRIEWEQSAPVGAIFFVVFMLLGWFAFEIAKPTEAQAPTP